MLSFDDNTLKISNKNERQRQLIHIAAHGNSNKDYKKAKNWAISTMLSGSGLFALAIKFADMSFRLNKPHTPAIVACLFLQSIAVCIYGYQLYHKCEKWEAEDMEIQRRHIIKAIAKKQNEHS